MDVDAEWVALNKSKMKNLDFRYSSEQYKLELIFDFMLRNGLTAIRHLIVILSIVYFDSNSAKFEIHF